MKGGPLIRVSGLVRRSLWRHLEPLCSGGKTSSLVHPSHVPSEERRCREGDPSSQAHAAPHKVPEDKGQILNIWRQEAIEETLQGKLKLQNGAQTVGETWKGFKFKGSLQTGREKSRCQAITRRGGKGWGAMQMAEGFGRGGEKIDG